MEWISHSATGFFLGQLIVREEERPTRAGWWWAIASISPDWLEVFTRWAGDIHRGVTHSLYLWPFLSLAWALAARKWGWGESGVIASLGRLWVTFMVVVGSHFLLDVFMSYRWYLAWPFSQENWAWGIMPFFDVYVFAGWLVLWYLNRRLRWSSQVTARLGLAIILCMFCLRGVAKMRAQSIMQGEASAPNSVVPETRPTYYQPWIWFVHSGSDRHDWTPLNVLTGELLLGYTRGGGFPPLPGQEIIKSAGG